MQGSDVAATTINFNASFSSNVLTICATVDLLPYTNIYAVKFISLIVWLVSTFWFIIVSTITAVLPVCLSPIINSLCPLPIGKTVNCFYSCLHWLLNWFSGNYSWSFNSALLIVTFSSGPLPSIGFPNPSTTLPSRDFPVGTSTMDLVLPRSPSFIDLSLPKITIPTLSSSLMPFL